MQCKAINDPNTPRYQTDRKIWIPSRCECRGAQFELANDILSAVAKGLSQLDNILCAVILQSFMDIVQIGTSFIPGVGELSAMTASKAAVKRATSMAENTLNQGGFDDVSTDIIYLRLGLSNTADY